jgi:WD40 repeat protein
VSIDKDDEKEIYENEDEKKVGMVMCVAFIGTTHLMAGYEDGTVIMWQLDFDSGHAREAWRGRTHGETVLCAEVDATGRGAVSGGADGVLIQYEVDVTCDPVCVKVVRKHGPYAQVVSASSAQPGVNAASIRRDGKIVACGCWDGKIRVFEYKVKSKGRLLAVLKYHEASVTDVVFAPDNSCLVSTSRDGTVALWNIFSP